MDRRSFLAFGAGLLVISGPAGAQTPKNAARVGLLSPGDSKTRAWAVDAVRKTLHGQGWVEGDNLVIEYRALIELDASARIGSFHAWSARSVTAWLTGEPCCGARSPRRARSSGT